LNACNATTHQLHQETALHPMACLVPAAMHNFPAVALFPLFLSLASGLLLDHSWQPEQCDAHFPDHCQLKREALLKARSSSHSTQLSTAARGTGSAASIAAQLSPHSPAASFGFQTELPIKRGSKREAMGRTGQRGQWPRLERFAAHDG
jgi:hypothetical protein